MFLRQVAVREIMIGQDCAVPKVPYLGNLADKLTQILPKAAVNNDDDHKSVGAEENGRENRRKWEMLLFLFNVEVEKEINRLSLSAN
jgi:hypothetical protein